jgi:dTDP-4-dehydrorhamnose 3,5-epimerase
VVLYKCDSFYNKESEGGILFNDDELNIDWGVPEKDMVVSEKDTILIPLKNCKTNFEYHT